MKKMQAEYNIDLTNAVDVFLENLENGYGLVNDKQAQKIADMWAVLGKNTTTHSLHLHTQVYRMGVDRMAEAGQVVVLQKILENLENTKPVSLYKMPRNMMRKNDAADPNTVPDMVETIVFGGVERRNNAYMRLFTENKLQEARAVDQHFEKEGVASIPDDRCAPRDHLREVLLLSEHGNAHEWQAIRKAFYFKSRVHSNRPL